MRKSLLALFLVSLCSVGQWTAKAGGSPMQDGPAKSGEVKIRVGSKSFETTLVDNESARRLRESFPLTIKMKDLHGNEKYLDLPKALPTNASVPNAISAGDVMLYGSNTLVIFYESFQTTYSYTRPGRINDPTELKAALGSGDVTVTIGSE